MKKLKQKLTEIIGEKKVASLKKVLNIGRIIKNVICWSLVAVFTLAIITFMVTKVSGGTPSLFGYSLHRIVSGSMEPELRISDVILNKDVHDASGIHIGDIVTFQGGANYDYQKITHRILVAPYDNGNGETVLVTKGDANEYDDGEILFSDVESKYVIKVAFLKSLYNFFFSPWGFIIFIFLLLLIFFDEIMNIVRLIISGREQEQPETLIEIVERLQREQQDKAEDPDKSNADQAVSDAQSEQPQPKAKKQIPEQSASDKKSDKKTDNKKLKKKPNKNKKNNKPADRKQKQKKNPAIHPKKKSKKKSKKRKKR